MSRSAVVFGRTASDVIYNVLSLLVMALAGVVVGWRIHNGIVDALLGFGLLLLFAYAFSWIVAYVGLVVPSAEVVNNASTMVIFPLTFIANTFVPSDDFPTPLRIFAERNPVSAATHAARERFGNLPEGLPDPTAWPLQNAALYALIWVAIIIAVFAPLAVRRYQKVGAKS
jgi:ABC-2 type transport system permease protein